MRLLVTCLVGPPSWSSVVKRIRLGLHLLKHSWNVPCVPGISENVVCQPQNLNLATVALAELAHRQDQVLSQTWDRDLLPHQYLTVSTAIYHSESPVPCFSVVSFLQPWVPQTSESFLLDLHAVPLGFCAQIEAELTSLNLGFNRYVQRSLHHLVAD